MITATTFDKAFKYVLTNEGEGYEEVVGDRGGCTKAGLTLQTALLCPEEGIRTCEDLKNMTLDTAKRIYYQLFWKYGRIQSEQVAIKLFDIAVNCGSVTATRLAQKSANQCGFKLLVDGQWGPHTENAINTIESSRYLAALVDFLHEYYMKIVNRDLTQTKFLRGWLLRADRLPAKES